jgi:hypothetical protein
MNEGLAEDPPTLCQQRSPSHELRSYNELRQAKRKRALQTSSKSAIWLSIPMFLKSGIMLRILRVLGIIRIAGRRQLAVTGYCLRSFLDDHLKEVGAPQLKIPSPLYREVQVLK